MNSIISSIINKFIFQIENVILGAILVFFLLLLFFALVFKVHNLEIKNNKKYGLATGILLMLFTLVSCAGLLLNAGDREKNKEKSSNPAKPLLPETTSGFINQKFSERIKKLNETAEWKAFKGFWKELDLIEPKYEKSGNGPSDLMGEYIDSKKAGELQQEMAKVFGYENYDDFRGEILFNKAIDENLNPASLSPSSAASGLKELVQENKISLEEMKILAKVCDKRLEYLYYGFSSMMMRMMPSRALIESEKNIEDLEQKIDMLFKLGNSGKVSEEEFNTALANIQNDIKLFLVWDTVNSNYSRLPYGYSLYDLSDGQRLEKIDAIEKRIDEYYAEYKKEKEGRELSDMDDAYQKTKNEIEKMKNIFPALDELVADLER